MSVKTTESPNRIPPRRYPPGARRAERPTIEQVEAALADAPHRHIGRRPPRTEKFVSRASGGAPVRAGDTGDKPPLQWKDAAAFGEAQDFLRNKGHLEQRRREALRFHILVTAGIVVAFAFVLLAVLK